MSESPVLALTTHFLVLSLVAVGGGNSILPDMHRFVVDVHGWMTAAEFSQLYAIAQASPGPNIMVVTLIGWHVAGFPGAVASTLAICTPSSILAYAVAQVWYRFRGRPWRAALQAGRARAADGRPHPRRRLGGDARRRPQPCRLRAHRGERRRLPLHEAQPALAFRGGWRARPFGPRLNFRAHVPELGEEADVERLPQIGDAGRAARPGF
jgi:hypothetical protein